MKQFGMKWIFCLAVLFALGLLMCACDPDGETTDGTKAPSSDTEEQLQKKTAVLFENGSCPYTVTYGEFAPLELQKISMEVQRQLRQLTGCDIGISNDFEYQENKYEIVIGNTSYPQTVQAADTFAYADYGIRVIGNKIIVFGHNATSAQRAAAEFLRLVKASAVKENGKISSIVLDLNDVTDGRMGNWVSDVPQYEGGSYRGGQDLANDTFQIIYEKTNRHEFETYQRKLKKNGFVLYGENQVADNIFATYTKEKALVHVTFDASKKAAFVIGSFNGGAALPTAMPAPQKISNDIFAVISPDYSHRDVTDGNGLSCALIQQDGSYIIFDGGYRQDADRLYQFLKDNNPRKDGIHIACWVLTHSHVDHYSCFDEFSSKHGKEVTLDYVLANPTHKTNYHKDYLKVYDPYLTEKLPMAIRRFNGDAKLIKAHTGQKLCFGSAVLEVMFTHEMVYPMLLKDLNDSSTVIRAHAAGKTVMITGDVIGAMSCGTMERMYGVKMEADIVQATHHGYSGGSRNFYRMIHPKLAFWPTSQEAFERRKKESWIGAPNFELLQIIGGEKHALVADGPCKLIDLSSDDLFSYRSYEFH